METADALIERLKSRLDPIDAPLEPPARSDGDLNGGFPTPQGELRQAAVLAPLILHAGAPRLLLTERAAHLPKHPGQISFPGGSIDPGGESPAEAAVRELEEEVGISATHVELIGRFDGYRTGTGFHITPFVGVLRPGYTVRPDPSEVADVFETPFAFLMDPGNHQKHAREWQGVMRHYYAMPWQDRYIWGATAGMLKSLHDRLYG
ncbi:NUDIX hydrolase [Maricaulis parjimensis]|uniref:NUDIX hydrolase n=1 Tax=Maricaulis parjimensis TaxID=144023 RepID=UPI001939296C|nr:CoA pyrophosphatase [Maricaulis parjimensis]